MAAGRVQYEQQRVNVEGNYIAVAADRAKREPTRSNLRRARSPCKLYLLPYILTSAALVGLFFSDNVFT